MGRLFVLCVTSVLWACAPGAQPSPDLRAFGNEPFWHVVVSATGGIVYGRLGEEELSFPYAPPKSLPDGSAGWVFGPVTDAAGEHRIEIRIRQADCADTMADLVHPMAAAVVIDGERLAGCARRADDPVGEAP